jgi:hypothetical protein
MDYDEKLPAKRPGLIPARAKDPKVTYKKKYQS